MIVSLFKYHLVISLFFILSLCTSAVACDGQERTEALQIIYESLVVGYQAGLTGEDLQSVLSKSQQLSRRAQALSPSCQVLIEQVGQGLQERYNPNVTRCMGGVCCNGSGCI